MIDVYGELAEPSRRSILFELIAGAKTVSEIVENTQLKQPNVSNHLAKLRARSIVRANKVGRRVYYSLASPDVHAVVVGAFRNSTSTIEVLEFAVMAAEFAQNAIDGDEGACCRVVDAAVRQKAPILEVLCEIIGGSLDQIWEWWLSDKIDAGQQRVAETIAERAVARVAYMTAPRQKLDALALLGCSEGACRTITLRMFSEYLRSEGWSTVSLGPSSPTDAFVSAADRYQPHMIIVGCGDGHSLTSAASVVERLRSMDGAPKIGIAGPIALGEPEALRDLHVEFRARDLRDFAERCLPMVQRPVAALTL